ncbi:MAG: radical SAM protein [Candidatus Woesearchaeota archaeon]|nr:radical SAM protein [Candidatus Woesearchaeota archaeon]
MGKIIFVKAPATLKDIYGDLAAAGNEQAPIGLAQLAAITRQNNHDTEILDCGALNLGYSQALKIILDKKPDYVGLSSTTAFVDHAGKLAKMIKQKNNKITILVGGPHITALPEKTMDKYPQFDIGVLGEADITITELLESLDNKKDLSSVKGLMYRQGKKLVKTEPRGFVEDLDTLPMPAYDLLPDITKYYMPPANSLYRLPSISIITSRGCPMQCTFCANVVFGNRCRAHSAEYVMKTIRYLYDNYGIREIQIYEDNFAAYRERLIKLCKMLIKEKLDLSFWCMASVNMVNPEVLKLMKQAGFWQIAYGCESGSQMMLDKYKKNVKLERIDQALKWTKEAGISTKGFFMIGGPNETNETMKQTVDFIKRLPLDDFHVTFFAPLPGSEIYANVKKYGTFDEDWEKMNMFDKPSFIPHGLKEEDMVYYYKKAYRQFYLRPRTIWYFIKKLRNPTVAKKIIISGFAFLKFLFKKER